MIYLFFHTIAVIYIQYIVIVQKSIAVVDNFEAAVTIYL